MAHCSAAELAFSTRRLENVAQISGWDYHISFDVLFEGLRHHLIDLVSLLRARDHRQLLGLRDLLTSLKVDSGECTCTGQFSLYRHSFQDLGQANHRTISAIAAGSRVLHSIVLDGGSAKWGLLWLRSEYRELGQDSAVSVHVRLIVLVRIASAAIVFRAVCV